ncbi:hypothetical protein FD27_GL000342 [Limosilactobacillus frumenti DSM 13145]|uniref:N-acetyltransferase domain-containing protein n=1 Tax=Limosilactobacillus frumenti DSM 13145 TaxID=1423746 RepID=A0A0R1PBR3_9LACO|nr:GNAT family N-acetyltransferase [Limosilactobacillus frumenti]KRL28068.1 hypothetical protein FD27_GL000342 [Limosilactobacillus frumenti DSM 13145]MBA2913439.1 GNAT family N-acetyltransferase [Limosilactobacillus frumenti]
MKKLELITIGQQNTQLLSPLLQDPALLLAAGLTYSPTMGLLGIQLIAAREHLFAITFHEQTVGILLLGHQYGQEGEILPKQWEVGYAVLPQFQNQGIASAAVQQVIAQLTRQHRISIITADIKTDNGPSQAVVRHCGFSLIASRNGIQRWQFANK